MDHRRTEQDRAITAAGLSRLLAKLDHDVEPGGEALERLRGALVKFFDWRGAWAPEECADEVLDRLERKLEETSIEDVWEDARGVARMVLVERRRRPAQSPHGNKEELAIAPAPSLRPEG